MRLADYVISRLADAGIAHAFGVCGGGGIFLFDALRKSDRMKFIPCHHEQAAAMAAESYARARNGIGLCVVTSGPGGTNAITGVAGAWTDSVPMIVISGQVFRSQMMTDKNLRSKGVQEVNIVDMVLPVTKYAEVVRDPMDIQHHLMMAIHAATHGRPGPVWLDIPADVQNADIDPRAVKESIWYQKVVSSGTKENGQSVKQPEHSDVVATIDALRAAKRPLLHIGQGIRLADAIPELDEFLQRTGIPVVTARNGADIIPHDHPCFVGRPGTFAQRGANFAVQTCDLYIAIGTRLSLAQTGYNSKDYARNARIIQVDIDAPELDKGTLREPMLIQADAKAFLNAFLDEACEKIPYQAVEMERPVMLRGRAHPLPDWSAWLAHCKSLQAAYPPGTTNSAPDGYVDMYDLIRAVSANAEPGDVIVTDMGYSFQSVYQCWEVKQGQRLLTNTGLAPMGWGLPAAVGAAIGTGRRVICITGDGGIMMNLQELATIAHQNLNVKIVLVNNGGYLTMRKSQEHAFGAHMGSDESGGLGMPDFDQTARSFGLNSRTLLHGCTNAITHFLSWLLGIDGPALLEVYTDPNGETVPKSVNRRLDDGTIQQTAIEDSWPYLSQEEINLRMEICNG